jgi:hypothetical protein
LFHCDECTVFPAFTTPETFIAAKAVSMRYNAVLVGPQATNVSFVQLLFDNRANKRNGAGADIRING